MRLVNDDTLGGATTPGAGKTPWQYQKQAGFQKRPLRVAISGAGASGICLGVQLLKGQEDGTLGPIDFTIFERHADYGGTWAVNNYPGCRCDVPAHVYTFSWAPYADWPEYYSQSPDINTYFHLVAQKGGIVPHMKLSHTIRSATFNEKSSTWLLSIEGPDGVFDHEVDVYVPANGVLSQVNRPSINGLENFTKNPILHTAEWPRHLDYTTAFKDERVAVIGIGSSGVQTIGAIAPHSKNVNIFARSPFWISPPFVKDAAGERDWKVGNFEYVFVHGTETNIETREIVRKMMHEELKGRPDLIEKLIPKWDIWCRRVTPCISFMDALHMPQVDLITEGIASVSADGITTGQGNFVEVDRIILATGFDTSFKPKYPITAKGKNLSDVWSKRSKAYMSIAVAGFPNFFYMCGPGTIFANGSLLPGIEANAAYIIQCLAKMQTHEIAAMDVQQDAQDEYNEQQESLMADLVFSDQCSSWYKGGNAEGKPDALYAGSVLGFLELLRTPRWEDWKYKSIRANRFSFLGNGTSTIEATQGDRVPYLKLEDHFNPLRVTDLEKA
ncbi:hypothetical protein RQP46_008001 [Phenoliferia psychrophenolica]